MSAALNPQGDPPPPPPPPRERYASESPVGKAILRRHRILTSGLQQELRQVEEHEQQRRVLDEADARRADAAAVADEERLKRIRRSEVTAAAHYESVVVARQLNEADIAARRAHAAEAHERRIAAQQQARAA